MSLQAAALEADNVSLLRLEDAGAMLRLKLVNLQPARQLCPPHAQQRDRQKEREGKRRSSEPKAKGQLNQAAGCSSVWLS